MPLFIPERRGPRWKHGWRGHTLSSLSLPPAPLLSIFAIVALFLWLTWYTDYKAHMERTEVGLRCLLILVPLLLFFLARYAIVDGRFTLNLRRPRRRESLHRAGGSPWGVALVVVLLLVMVSYQSSFRSQWFRPLWKST